MANEKEQTYRLDVPHSVVDRVVGALETFADDCWDEMRNAGAATDQWKRKAQTLEGLAESLKHQRDG